MFGIRFVKDSELKQMRRDLKFARAELEAEKERMREVMYSQGESVKMLSKMLSKESARANEYERRLGVCDEARASLGEKNRKLRDENERLMRVVDEYKEELEALRDACKDIVGVNS